MGSGRGLAHDKHLIDVTARLAHPHPVLPSVQNRGCCWAHWSHGIGICSATAPSHSKTHAQAGRQDWKCWRGGLPSASAVSLPALHLHRSPFQPRSWAFCSVVGASVRFLRTEQLGAGVQEISTLLRTVYSFLIATAPSPWFKTTQMYSLLVLELKV